MSDETTTRVDAGSETAGTPGTTTERVGFCQDCGKPLNRETVRTVGAGVFCEPCLETRLGTSQTTNAGAPYQAPAGGYTTTNTTGPAYGSGYSGNPSGVPYGGGTVPPVTHILSGNPKPVLAGVLGVIPGVGACYNGQYAKGMIHLVIFLVLSSISDHVGIFGLAVLAWEVYQVADAYHTAKARRDGLPLPNPFGFNEAGERMGFGTAWSGGARSATGPVTATQQPPVTQPGDPAAWGAPMTPPPAPPATPYASVQAAAEAGYAAPPQASYAPVNYGAPQQAGYAVPPANWAGYVPPVHFATTPPVTTYAAPTPEATAEAIKAQAMRDAGYGPVGFSPAYSGTEGPPNYPTADLLPTPRASRFPVGAVWLIALGALVLAGTLAPSGIVSEQWVLAAIFAGLAAWIFTRRVGYLGGPSALHADNAPRLVCSLRAPVILLTLAVLFALQAGHVATLGQTWGVLVIVFGAMLLAERTIGSSGPVYSGPVTGYPAGYVPPPGYPAPPAAYPAAPVVEAPQAAADEAAKGGQQ